LPLRAKRDRRGRCPPWTTSCPAPPSTDYWFVDEQQSEPALSPLTRLALKNFALARSDPLFARAGPADPSFVPGDEAAIWLKAPAYFFFVGGVMRAKNTSSEPYLACGFAWMKVAAKPCWRPARPW
jgi:hypothetical protein